MSMLGSFFRRRSVELDRIDYVALDVETANTDCATICQIGVAVFVDGKVAHTWSTLLDPEDYFDSMNVLVHGITPSDVMGAPRFPDALAELRSLIEGQIVVHHMPFDRVAVGRATEKYSLPPVPSMWLDSARVARRTWVRFARRGYGLKNIAKELRIPLQHHDALSDATAAGMIVARSITETGITASEWLARSLDPLVHQPGVARPASAVGSLSGERIVFTGALSMPRREAAGLAAAVGASVGETVSKSTTILVVGLQDLRRTGGAEKSSKHCKAEALVTEGYPIAIIGEDDFRMLAGLV